MHSTTCNLANYCALAQICNFWATILWFKTDELVLPVFFSILQSKLNLFCPCAKCYWQMIAGIAMKMANLKDKNMVLMSLRKMCAVFCSSKDCERGLFCVSVFPLFQFFLSHFFFLYFSFHFSFFKQATCPSWLHLCWRCVYFFYSFGFISNLSVSLKLGHSAKHT